LPAVVVGHSFGGQVALRLAARHPEAIRALVLVGPSGVVRLPPRTRVLAVLTTVLRPGARAAPLGARLAGQAWFRRIAFGPLLVADPAALPERAVRGFFAELREHDDVRTARRAILADAPFTGDPALECPAVVLWGAADAVVPVEHGFALARAAHIRLRTIADCGHLLIGERPDAVADAIAAVAQTGFSTSRNSHSTPN
jgi:esterase